MTCHGSCHFHMVMWGTQESSLGMLSHHCNFACITMCPARTASMQCNRGRKTSLAVAKPTVHSYLQVKAAWHACNLMLVMPVPSGMCADFDIQTACPTEARKGLVTWCCQAYGTSISKHAYGGQCDVVMHVHDILTITCRTVI